LYNGCIRGNESKREKGKTMMTVEMRRELVRLAKLDVEEFDDFESRETLKRMERRLEAAIREELASGSWSVILEDMKRGNDAG
jgi:hypothetical protein